MIFYSFMALYTNPKPPVTVEYKALQKHKAGSIYM